MFLSGLALKQSQWIGAVIAAPHWRVQKDDGAEETAALAEKQRSVDDKEVAWVHQHLRAHDKVRRSAGFAQSLFGCADRKNRDHQIVHKTDYFLNLLSFFRSCYRRSIWRSVWREHQAAQHR